MRTPDEYVDNPKQGDDPKQKLEQWKNDWIKTFHTGEGENEILLATREIFQKYKIPLELSIEFIDSMIQDLNINRYDTYKDLQSYMRGSAESVGVMLTYIFGYKSEAAFPYARKLGEAMQLTNFLRDIKEDYFERNRIYLPKEYMQKFGVSEEDIKSQNMSQNFKQMMTFLIQKARDLYRESDPGIEMLSQKTRLGVRAASGLYEKILDKIEDQNYDIYKQRARTNFLEKVWLISEKYVK